MSGLLQKDLCLLKSNRKTLVLFLALAVVISLGQTNTFILGYFPFLMIIMLTGTISYDEMDNGFPFLFTLPVDRKMYIREKYLLCILGVAGSFLIALALYFASLMVNGVADAAGQLLENAGMFPVVLAVFFLAIAVTIPIQVKYGAEGSRIVLAGICFLGAGVILFVHKTAGDAALEKITSFSDMLEKTSGKIGAFAVGIAALLISYGISVRVMEKKEF
ncbi:ABC-2 transporter permease [Fusicatenibacter sp.]